MKSPQRVEQKHAPHFLVQIEPEGGKAEPIDLSDRVISFEYQDNEKKADRMTIQVDNFTGSAWDEATFKKGNLMRIRWGYPGFMSPERQVVITKATGGIVMTVEAKDRSVLMHRKTEMQTYENLTRSDVVREIAKRNGFGVEAQHIEDTTQTFETIVQPNISDARMLKRLAFKEGFEFFIDHDGLHWHRRDLAQAPTREFRWYNGDITEENAIESYSVENDLTAKPAKTKLRGRNPRTGKPYEVVGSNADTKRDVLSEIVEIRDYETGEWKKELRASSEETKPSSEADENVAKKRADGRFRKISQTAVKLTLQVIGDPLVLAKTVVIVSGLGKRLSGRYYVKEVTHSIADGYPMTLKLITDGSRGHTGVSVNEALFPPDRTSKGAGDPFGASINLVNVLDDAQNIVAFSEAGQAVVGVGSFIAQANAVDQRVTENPADVGAYKEAVRLGQRLKDAGGAANDRNLKRAGGDQRLPGTRGQSAGAAAKSKGELNTKPLDEDRKALVRDPATGQWVSK
jgi:phage protein D